MQLSLLEKYKHVKSELDSYKKLELELRLAILDSLFPSASSGTFHAHLGPFKAKGVFKLNTTVDRQALEDNVEMLTPEEIECITWKPSLSQTKYKALLEDETSGFLESCLEVKPATPSLTVEIEE